METRYTGRRDIRFVREERGGFLNLQIHRSLVFWSANCAERVLILFEQSYSKDRRPADAIAAARSWASGDITMTEVRAFASAAHAAARTAIGAAREAARAAGHAAATAHMADHQLGSAFYALRAIRAAYPKNLEKMIDEREWQKNVLTADIRELVLDDMKNRSKKFQNIFLV